MNVSDEVRRAYKSDSVQKTLVLTFPELSLTIPTSEVYAESMNLYESILENTSIEFVGCISSKFEVQIRNNATYQKVLKGKRIEATIYTEGTEDEPIPLFKGIVDEAKKETGKNFIKITAYDILYKCGQVEVANWYNNLHFPITLGALRRSLLSYIHLPYVESTLPNDSVVINKQYEPKTLQSLVVLKSLCQINGCFGIVNRDGLFEFRYLKQTVNALYPSLALFPSYDIFPGGSSESPYRNSEIMGYYRLVEYQDFEVKPVDKVTIRESETDTGVTYGSGENNYIIQANMFAYKLSTQVLKNIAREIYMKVQNITYYPYLSTNNGLPYAECGVDAVSFYYLDAQQATQSMDFYIFNRKLTGIQALKDNFESKGEEYQNEFITDINARLQTIQTKQDTSSKDYDYKFEEYDSDWDNLYGTFGGQEVMVVVNWDASTGILETSSTMLS